MERFLIENEIMNAPDKKTARRTDKCPDESWYWDFMDDNVSDEQMTTHAASCGYCRNELMQVGRAMLARPSEDKLAVSSMATPSLAAGLAATVPDDKVTLKAIGGYIMELFNSMDPVPAYRTQAAGPMVLAAPGALANFKVELTTAPSGKFNLIAQLGSEKSDDFILELSDATGVLRSFSLKKGERRSLGEWTSGRYRVTLKLKNKDHYSMELDLR
jgi:hypothetical protein